jgi:hypothetical protein
MSQHRILSSLLRAAQQHAHGHGSDPCALLRAACGLPGNAWEPASPPYSHAGCMPGTGTVHRYQPPAPANTPPGTRSLSGDAWLDSGSSSRGGGRAGGGGSGGGPPPRSGRSSSPRRRSDRDQVWQDDGASSSRRASEEDSRGRSRQEQKSQGRVDWENPFAQRQDSRSLPQ